MLSWPCLQLTVAVQGRVELAVFTMAVQGRVELAVFTVAVHGRVKLAVFTVDSGCTKSC